MDGPRAWRVAVTLVAAAALAGAAAAAVLAVRPPAARGVAAPAGQFSAGRAYRHVETIAAGPHVAGSAANDRVRDYLLATLRGLGLSPQVQDAVDTSGSTRPLGSVHLARVRNVVAVLPGTAPTGRVLLVAHYDSVQTGPGGNDDGAGVAALLESARALTAGPRPRNDVVFVLTDAEEACLCGAAAFVRQHPLAAGGGVVLNMEARGSTGPAIMFQTSENNAALIAAYAGTPRPVGTSVAVEIYRLLPNDTDLTPFLAAGFAGLNSAYIDGAGRYHTPLDTPAATDTDSLQHHGANALALLRTFGAADLTAVRAGGDATYFPVPGGLIRYPGGLTWPVAVLAAFAVLALAVAARRRGTTTGRRLAAGFALALLPLVAAPLLGVAFFRVLTAIRPGYAALLDPYHPLPFRLAVLALTAAAVLVWYAALHRRVGPPALAVGALGWPALLGLALAAYAPGGSYLGALTALVGAVAGLVALRLPPRWAPVAGVAGAAVAIVVVLPTVLMLFPALGLRMGAVAALLATLLAFVLLPVVQVTRRRVFAAALAAALIAVALTVVGLRVNTFDATEKSPTHLMYALDTDTGRARWLSAETTAQPWTSQFVSAPGSTVVDSFPALGDTALLGGPAAAAPLPAPQITTTGDTRTGDLRTLRLRLTPKRPVRMLALHVDARSTVVSATVGGRPVPVGEKAGGRWGFGFVFHAPPPDGVPVELTVRGTGAATVRVMDGSDGLAGLPGFRPRPASVGVAGSHTSELVAVAHTATF